MKSVSLGWAFSYDVSLGHFVRLTLDKRAGHVFGRDIFSEWLKLF